MLTALKVTKRCFRPPKVIPFVRDFACSLWNFTASHQSSNSVTKRNSRCRMKASFGRRLALGERKDSSNCITHHGTHGEVEQVAEEPMRSILAATLDCHRPSGSDAGMATEY